MAKLKPPVSSKDHMKGSPDAPFVLVEYGDFQCPHCGIAHPIVKKVLEAEKENVAFVFRHFPLAEIHPYAQAAAVAAEAAALQGKFWEMHELIFNNQESLGLDMLIGLAEKLELDMKKFQHDFKDPALFQKVEDDFESGIVSGVNGTPSFYINGTKYNGPYDFKSLTHAMEKKEG